jgi:antirestriction protein ArdC
VRIFRLPPAHIVEHSAYIGHWMQILQNDTRAFLFAAAQAQLAVDWLLAKSPAPAFADAEQTETDQDVET